MSVSYTHLDVYKRQFMVYAESPQGDISRSLAGKGVGMKIVECHYPPTCEMMLSDFAEKIRAELPEGIDVYKRQPWGGNGSARRWCCWRPRVSVARWNGR